MTDIIFQWHTKSPDLKTFLNGILAATEQGCKSLLLLACSDNNIDITACNKMLSKVNITVFGGVYPKLIFNKKVVDSGYIVIGFKQKLAVHNFLDVSSRIDTDDATEGEIEKNINHKSQAYFLFHDALSPNSESFIDSLFYCLGNIKIIGGGAGSLDFIPKPCIFSNQGLLQDATQLVALNTPLSLGISHGWQVFDGPYLVTESSKHIVHSFNYQPAFSTYKKVIESASEHRFNDNNFFDIAKNFPLGIHGANDEIVVRDPIQVDGENLDCVGNIPINSMVYILKGDTESLIRSVEIATLMTNTNQVTKGKNLFVVDCISRYLYLGDSFKLELAAMIDKHQLPDRMFGVLSLGEITNSHSGAIKLLNKSTVLGTF
ncbi:FIST signal transduction protein [Thalassotalea agariperforans]